MNRILHYEFDFIFISLQMCGIKKLNKYSSKVNERKKNFIFKKERKRRCEN